MTFGKRLFDITLALVLALVLALPFGVLLIVLLLREGRPVFYVERMRAPGRSFRLWKVRTKDNMQRAGLKLSQYGETWVIQPL